MKTPEHIALSVLLAELYVQGHYGTAGTWLMIAAGNLPDLDGVTFLAGRQAYRRYHRVVGHGLPVTLLGPAALTVLGVRGLGLEPAWPLGTWLFVSLLAHLATDALFYRWPVQLLWPIASVSWGGGLVHWNDLVPTLILVLACGACLAWPGGAHGIATAGLSAFLLYLAWRAWRPRSRWGWSGWITGDWAGQSPRFWRWLTGDFVT